MKISAVVAALTIASASAFAPSAGMRAETCLNVDRRGAFGQIAAAAAVVALPGAALADGATSSATITKARVVYGSRIADLKAAVGSGDFGAVAEEKAAFILFNSGAYPGAKNKAAKADAVAGTNAIFAAIRSGDKAGLKTAYDGYVAGNSITGMPTVSADQGQGFGNDYSYVARTKAGSVYVR